MTATPAHRKHGYSTVQIALHWTVAVLVAANLLLGGAMAEVFDAVQDGEEVDSLGAAYAHILIGSSILLLMVVRLAARLGRPVATNPDSPHRVLALLGRINHWTFYVILILLPLGGIVAWFAGSEAAGRLHGLLATALLAVIALHVAAALFHQLVLRENLLRRIIRPT